MSSDDDDSVIPIYDQIFFNFSGCIKIADFPPSLNWFAPTKCFELYTQYLLQQHSDQV